MIKGRRQEAYGLAAATNAVMKDTNWLNRFILDKLVMLQRPADSGPTIELGVHQRDVLDLICGKLDDATMAERLELSRNTVRKHVACINAKMGVNRRSGAVCGAWHAALAIEQ